VAAWQYRWLADWFETFYEADVAGRHQRVPDYIFLPVLIIAGASRTAYTPDHESGGTDWGRPDTGRTAGSLKGSLVVAIGAGGHGCFRARRALAPGSQLAPYFHGRRAALPSG